MSHTTKANGILHYKKKTNVMPLSSETGKKIPVSALLNMLTEGLACTLLLEKK